MPQKTSDGPVPNLPGNLHLYPGQFSMISWNCRGLFHHNHTKRQSSLEHLARFARGKSVVMLQETHGEEHEIKSAFNSIFPGWAVFHSSFVKRDGTSDKSTGGVVILVAPQLATIATIVPGVLMAGRVQTISLQIRGSITDIMNVHNCELPLDTIKHITKFLQEQRARDVEDPMKFSTLVAGDFNFAPPGVAPKSLRDPMAEILHSDNNPSFNRKRYWITALEDFTEILQPHPTRYNQETGTLTHLDRIWTTWPRSWIIKLDIRANVCGAPEALHNHGISDHSPLELYIAHLPNKPEKSTSFSIPRHWCKSQAFADRLNFLTIRILKDSMLPFERLDAHKICIYEAAKHARDLENFSDSQGTESRRLVFESMARAIWSNDLRAAKKLISKTEVGRKNLKIENGRVLPIDFKSFEENFAWEKQEHFERERQNLNKSISQAKSINKKKQLKGRIQAARRKSATWWPKSSRLYLKGVRVQEPGRPEFTLADPEAIQEKLTSHWGQVFQKHPVDNSKARSLLDIYSRKNGTKFGFEVLALPEEEDFEHTIKHATDSAPGRDGIPFSAWKANPSVAARTLHPVALSMAVAPAVLGFNDQNMVFSPKAESVVAPPTPEDRTLEFASPAATTRKVENLRTISLLNSDNKIIASTINRKLLEPTLALTPMMQRGFCKGRQFMVNVVELDAFMRLHNSCFEGKLPEGVQWLPILALYDLCNAFPSIAHDWLFNVLLCLRLPPLIYNIIWHLYQDSRAFSCGVGTNEFMFEMLSGVRTGCPLSATLFLLAFNPFVDLFERLSDIPRCSCTAMCADDVGSAIKALRYLKVQFSIFKVAEQVACMKLKPGKCHLIVTAVGMSEFVIQAIRNWLKENIPEWANFQISDVGKYLGVWLGVRGDLKTYEAPGQKFQCRAEEIFGGGAPALPSLLRFNERAVPVFSYVAQVFAPRDWKKMYRFEQNAVHKVLHLPPNCMSRELFHSLEIFSGVVPRCLGAYIKSCMFRFAKSEEDTWTALRARLRKEIDQDAGGANHPIINLVSGTLPIGKLGFASLLDNMQDAIKFKGLVASHFPKIRRRNFPPPKPASGPSPGWVSPPPNFQHLPGVRGELFEEISKLDSGHHSQKKCYKLLLPLYQSEVIERTLLNKLVTTLGRETSEVLRADVNWFPKLCQILKECGAHTSFCLLKTWVGGWTTSHRMHEDQKLECLFGCPHEPDNLAHYLECAPLWFIVGEVVGNQGPIGVPERLCIHDPSPEAVLRLSLAFQGYHYAKSLVGSPNFDHLSSEPRRLQLGTAQAMRTFLRNFKAQP